jgi:dolichyl-phosphate beta-glucosyltransferase
VTETIIAPEAPVHTPVPETLPETATTHSGDDAPYMSIVMPAYNEEARLPAGIDRVLAFLESLPFCTELVVSDDGSTDATPGIVRERMRRAESGELSDRVRVRLVQHKRNQGKGAAIRTGILNADGRYIFFLDADLATPPEESSKLLPRLEAGVPVVIGSRIQPDGSDMRASQPRNRRLVGRIFTTMRKTLRVLPDIDDTQCPMKGFEHDAAKAIFAKQRLRGWIFDAEVLYIARQLGYRIESVPVVWRHVDGSRLRVRPSQAWEVLRDLVRLRFVHRG